MHFGYSPAGAFVRPLSKGTLIDKNTSAVATQAHSAVFPWTAQSPALSLTLTFRIFS